MDTEFIGIWFLKPLFYDPFILSSWRLSFKGLLKFSASWEKNLKSAIRFKLLSFIAWLFKRSINRKWKNGQNGDWKEFGGRATGRRGDHLRKSPGKQPFLSSLFPTWLTVLKRLPPLCSSCPAQCPPPIQQASAEWAEGSTRRMRGKGGLPLLWSTKGSTRTLTLNQKARKGAQRSQDCQWLKEICGTAIKVVRY